MTYALRERRSTD
ncbi:Hypothetical protein PFREUD_20500 [Propionibacterium freudenreichii subsp. shermanii CIRM-BIA1]|uniref:Uncharacterized protein n=1 Tax=Propionibacterium freudenreichii subsp. shermanii (strain ATCC 9614 / DSM 4902 / CIP 103027 / NCIMB 8099 / CIRM-BIA1) TaxID=754252 RepID=D7GG81_PROFC|nr:Hypothetical protein PFREUD_20500 [Propionibacterium freudenreichii subsp. shermanii CIRM-BIA1]